jgi:hypothetical protein
VVSFDETGEFTFERDEIVVTHARVRLVRVAERVLGAPGAPQRLRGDSRDGTSGAPCADPRMVEFQLSPTVRFAAGCLTHR